MKTLEKLQNAGIITKKETLHPKYIPALDSWNFEDGEQKIRTFHWRPNGRSARDYTDRIKEILHIMEIHYEEGNDAPKGGKNGYFVHIPLAMNYFHVKRLKEIIENS